MIARLRFFEIDCGKDCPGNVTGLLNFAVLSMEFCFKGIFNAVFPDISIVCIFQEIILFIFFLCHQTDVAEQVRRVLGIIVAYIGTGHFNPCQFVFHNGRNQAHACVLNKYIVRRVDSITHIDGIPDSRNQPHLFSRIAVVNIVAGTHVCHQFNCGRVLRKIVPFIPKISLQHRTLNLRHIRVILKRRSKSNRQIVGIIIPIPTNHVYQVKNNTVRIFTGKQLGNINFNIISFLITDKDTPVTVKNIASGSCYRFCFLDQFFISMVVAFSFDDLELVKEYQIDQDDYHKNDKERRNPAGFYKFIHEFLLTPQLIQWAGGKYANTAGGRDQSVCKITVFNITGDQASPRKVATI